MNVYFSDPYPPGSRAPMKIPMGRYVITLLKGSIGKKITDLVLATVVEKFNNRHWKCLNYQTHSLYELKSTGDALTT